MKRAEGEKGIILLETAISLPVLMILLTAAGAMLLWSVRHYFSVLADAELHQELQIAFSCLVQDMVEARSVAPCREHYPGLAIDKRWYALRERSESDEAIAFYWVNEVAGTKKLVRGADSYAPMTGNHSMAGVYIQELYGQEEAFHPGLYVIRLKGRSEFTNHYYTLSTAVYMPYGEREGGL